MHDDDRPIGSILTRRQALAVFGATATASLAHGARANASEAAVSLAMADCVAQPEQTEGPYFVDKALERSDIRRDPASGRISAGAPLALQFVLSRVTPTGACAVLPGAQVDIWHCDALGMYSGVEDRYSNTRGQRNVEMFLRGYQISDERGVVRFTTIYPGWYRGRAVHIHFKIRVPSDNADPVLSEALDLARAESKDEFTSQLYFPDALTDRVHATEPYAANKGQRLLNSRDMIFREGATQLVLPVVEAAQGYEATYRIAMRPGVSRLVPFGGRRGRL
jgi:protocatechuate 3,4-dioxygenase beta subunit